VLRKQLKQKVEIESLNKEIEKSRDSITKLVKKLGANGEDEVNRREQDL
jgi:hypothetical protein